MDMSDNNRFSDNLNPGEPVPLGNDVDKPIPLGDDEPVASVSRSPLNLGGSSEKKTPRIEVPKPAVQKSTTNAVSADRITGIKTFFTKLHPGAMQFLDEQIAKWLKENPGISVKRTNVTTGDVQAKKTEPNIIITVWY